MIEKTPMGNGFTIHCDMEDCDQEEEFDTMDNFMEAIDQAKELGWKIIKTIDGWEHYCPQCNKT